MPTDEELIQELYESLNATQFERFLERLLGSMGFEDIEHRGGPGDRGVDLEAIWRPQGIDIDLDLKFKVQAKRHSPSSPINPDYVNRLRGALMSGEYGLLITTARATGNTRDLGLQDSSRIVTVIDGSQLIELCRKYEIGVKPHTEYSIELSGVLEPREEELVEESLTIQVESARAIDPISVLIGSLSEEFTRLGNTPIYVGSDRKLLARVSKYYDRHTQNYWYGLKDNDLDRIEKYDVTHFAYITANRGVVLIPVEKMLDEIDNGRLGDSRTKDGSLIHYHIYFAHRGDSLFWIKGKGERENVDDLFHPLKVQG